MAGDALNRASDENHESRLLLLATVGDCEADSCVLDLEVLPSSCSISTAVAPDSSVISGAGGACGCTCACASSEGVVASKISMGDVTDELTSPSYTCRGVAGESGSLRSQVVAAVSGK